MLGERVMEKLHVRLLVTNEPAKKYVLALTLFFSEGWHRCLLIILVSDEIRFSYSLSSSRLTHNYLD